MVQHSRQIQSQTQQQTQTLSPQQILVVKLLELPAVEIEDRVHAELLENPALEEGKEESETDAQLDDFEQEASEEYDAKNDYLTEDDIPDYKLQDNAPKKSLVDDIPFAAATSFFEQLKEQLAEIDLTAHQRELAEYLVGSLDDDGLLRKSLEAIGDELAIYVGVDATEDELQKALKTVQELDPAGIGARDLKECLLIQIVRKEESPLRKIEADIIDKCYDEFTRKHWDKIKSRLSLTDEQFDEALADITKLNPRPGSSMGEFIGRNFQQIVPDFIVETEDDGTVLISLNNRNTPELRMNRDFVEMLHTESGAKTGKRSKAEKEAIMYLKQKIDAAQGFIDAVKQRQHTLMTTMQAIVDLQRPFFLEGDELLIKPMILKDVAEYTGLDISTISRVSNSKYVQTNYGIYSLKFFFNDGIVTDDGEEMSVREIKKVLQECIENEDKKEPLSDEVLTERLKEKGFPIARRTVAKYRQQLNIPIARLRK